MLSRLATVLQELSGEEGPDGDAQVRQQPGNQFQLKKHAFEILLKSIFKLQTFE